MSVNLPTLTDRNVERSVVVLCAKSSKNVVACVKVVVMSKWVETWKGGIRKEEKMDGPGEREGGRLKWPCDREKDNKMDSNDDDY